MKIPALIILIAVVFGCNPNQKIGSENNKELYWATKFADGVIHHSDSLIYYLREKPKYEYDYAF